MSQVRIMISDTKDLLTLRRLATRNTLPSDLSAEVIAGRILAAIEKEFGLEDKGPHDD